MKYKSKYKVIALIAIILLMFLANFSQVHAENIKSYEEGTIVEEIVKEVLPIKVPVLMYHHIDEKIGNSSIVSPEKFENDMIALKDAGYKTIFLSDLSDYLEGKKVLDQKSVIITFDDGYYSNYKYAYMIAKKYDMKINISIIGWSVGRSTFISSSKAIVPHFNWDEAREMARSGLVEIQNHTYDLHSPSGKSYGRSNDVSLGMNMLENESYYDYENRIESDFLGLEEGILYSTGKRASFLAYPYGAYSDESEMILKSLKYKGSLTVVSGIREFKTVDDLWLIPRINVTEKLTSELLFKRISELSNK